MPIWVIPIPLLIVLVAYLIRAALRVRRLLQVRRELHLQMMRDARLCLKCGYDVRHTTEGVCPECGWPVGRDP